MHLNMFDINTDKTYLCHICSSGPLYAFATEKFHICHNVAQVNNLVQVSPAVFGATATFYALGFVQ